MRCPQVSRELGAPQKDWPGQKAGSFLGGENVSEDRLVQVVTPFFPR